MSQNNKTNRRNFMAGMAVAMSAGSQLSAGLTEKEGPVTVQDVIDIIIGNTTGEPLPPERTIDTLKSGHPDQEVTGIATTFLASLEMLEKTHELGANLVLTHEPTYYNHTDSVDMLKGDPVYDAKREFIEESGIAIWRMHDYWHLHEPDGIINGLVHRLDLRQLYPDDKRLYDMPEISFKDLCGRCKKELKIEHLRVVGDPQMMCRKIGLFCGWGGVMGEPQIELLVKKGVDVVICGETAEWTTCEYARDAVTAGIGKGLIVLGHANSEEPGMEDVVEWLKPKLPGVPIYHVRASDPFRFI